MGGGGINIPSPLRILESKKYVVPKRRTYSKHNQDSLGLIDINHTFKTILNLCKEELLDYYMIRIDFYTFGIDSFFKIT